MPAENPVDYNIKEYIVHIDADGEKGTGILIAKNYILTCEHVITLCAGTDPGTKPIKIEWNDGFFDAELIHSSPSSDLALLKAPLDNNKHVLFGKNPLASRTVADAYLFAGFPDGRFKSGIFSYDGQEERDKLIFLKFKNSFVKPGTSGGPVFLTLNGELCAMMMENRSEDFPAGGLCIPVSAIIEELKKVEEFDIGLIQYAKEVLPDVSTNNMEGDWYIECNRDIPLNIFQEKVARKISRPQFFFIPGVVSDAHESLVKRFIRERSDGKNNSVKWIQIKKLDNLHKAKKKVFEETWKQCAVPNNIINEANQQDAGLIFEHSNLFPDGSITFISLELFLSRFSWNKNNTALIEKIIEEYISFWSVDFPDNKKNVEVYILFKLIVDGPCLVLKKDISPFKRIGTYFKRIGTYFKIINNESSVNQFINSIEKKYKDLQYTVTFDPLRTVDYNKVERLLREHKEKFSNNQYSALLEKFPKEEEWRMDKVETEIIDWFT